MKRLFWSARNLRLALFWPLLVLVTGPALADARLTVLVDVLKLPEAAQILREEGLSHATELDVDMLGGRGGPGWEIQIGAIYDTARMVETVRRALEIELQEPDLSAELEQTIDFFASELGTKIVSLENSARAAILDDDVEEAARARYMALEGTDDARLELIRGFVESGDMINRNVTSAMNSNYQFLRGLTEGRATQMSDEEILADVAEDIDEITDDTVSWLFGYLLLAYHPLSDAELQAYLTYSQTKAGQALNRGLFDGFGKAYEDISYALGRAVALNMTAEEL
ncbi:DUF2059 domain-containing protein [Sulfitobacter sp. MF3-043]|uniref:DUF2059 domain-containing protein n=1 Tax=Sulfitobacter sediminivivens TaxID=3252902 RepID=UPI0036DCA67D